MQNSELLPTYLSHNSNRISVAVEKKGTETLASIDYLTGTY